MSLRSSSRGFLAVVIASGALACSCASLPAPLRSDCSGSDVRDVPVVRLAAPRELAAPVRVAIMLTGDGGWRRIDDRVAARLRERGVPVVGFDTPAYYWKEKTPEVAACALGRLMRGTMERWQTNRVLLIGYSRGADILPFMINRLPADLASSVDVVALMGLESNIDFHYRPSWIPFHRREQEFPVVPEVEKMRGRRILCFYGEREKTSACPAVEAAGLVKAISEPGSHHFAGNYGGIADAILAAVP